MAHTSYASLRNTRRCKPSFKELPSQQFGNTILNEQRDLLKSPYSLEPQTSKASSGTNAQRNVEQQIDTNVESQIVLNTNKEDIKVNTIGETAIDNENVLIHIEDQDKGGKSEREIKIMKPFDSYDNVIEILNNFYFLPCSTEDAIEEEKNEKEVQVVQVVQEVQEVQEEIENNDLPDFHGYKWVTCI
ncbi:hypothetical protein HMI54_007610 [Coelomomyces lativittatus]|nr:hypothetical protein HMI54_007610 [Coelomomyces lativittatus]KAJ1511725.1 hypothetical protein HMI56_005039 [Coelomomyces lativittatus]